MIKIEKIKHSKVILIFVAIFILVLFISAFSKNGFMVTSNESKILIIDTNEKFKKGNASILDRAMEQDLLPKEKAYRITAVIKHFGEKTLANCDQMSNTQIIEWLLEYEYYVGYRINCIVGDWIILVNK